MVAQLRSRNENEVKIWNRGHNLKTKKKKKKKKEKTELLFLHATLKIDLFFNLTKYHKIFIVVVDLCSRNKDEEKIRIRGHKWKMMTSRVVMLAYDTPH